MQKEKVLEILDKNINQEQLVKDLAAELIKPWILEQKAKVLSKEIDLLPGQEWDNIGLALLLDKLVEQIGA